jgi:hypothetical protein
LTNAAAIPESRRSHCFGRFELQPAERRLLEDGLPVAVGALACAQRHSAMRREGGHLLDEHYAMANVALIELLLGRPEAALEHGRAAVAEIDALGAGGTVGHGRGHLYWAVMVALILLNRLAEAVAAGRMALAGDRAHGAIGELNDTVGELAIGRFHRIQWRLLIRTR